MAHYHRGKITWCCLPAAITPAISTPREKCCFRSRIRNGLAWLPAHPGSRRSHPYEDGYSAESPPTISLADTVFLCGMTLFKGSGH
jgi:hypothetical protein